MLENKYYNFCDKAIDLCEGRKDITYEMIESLLSHQDKYMAKSAYKVCFRNKIDIPVKRTITPEKGI